MKLVGVRNKPAACKMWPGLGNTRRKEGRGTIILFLLGEQREAQLNIFINSTACGS